MRSDVRWCDAKFFVVGKSFPSMRSMIGCVWDPWRNPALVTLSQTGLWCDDGEQCGPSTGWLSVLCLCHWSQSRLGASTAHIRYTDLRAAQTQNKEKTEIHHNITKQQVWDSSRHPSLMLKKEVTGNGIEIIIVMLGRVVMVIDFSLFSQHVSSSVSSLRTEECIIWVSVCGSCLLIITCWLLTLIWVEHCDERYC